MIAITKDTLRTLQASRGKLDTDTGQRFDGVRGRIDLADMLYHVEVFLADVAEDEDQPAESFSLKAALGAVPTEPTPDPEESDGQS